MGELCGMRIIAQKAVSKKSFNTYVCMYIYIHCYQNHYCDDKRRLWNRQAWVRILPLPLTSCVTLGKSLTLSEPYFSFKMGKIIPDSQGLKRIKQDNVCVPGTKIGSQKMSVPLLRRPTPSGSGVGSLQQSHKVPASCSKYS